MAREDSSGRRKQRHNVEIIYFDENVFKIESAVNTTVSKGSILCSFGTIHHNTKQFQLSDEFQAKLIQQVAEARHLLRKELLYYYDLYYGYFFL